MFYSEGKMFWIFVFKYPKMTATGQNTALLLPSDTVDAGLATPYKTADEKFCT